MTSIRTTTYVRALGACAGCGTGVAREDGATRTACPACGTVLVLHAVRGVYSEAHPCDPACQYAIGNNCECACGGDNHGHGYIAPIGERPEWVTVRDAERFAAKAARAAAKAQDARDAKAAEVAALIADHPLLTHLDTYAADVDFLDSLAEQLAERGTLTDRQVAAAEKVIGQRLARAARDAERAQRAAASGPAPLGKVTVTGELVSVKDQPGFAYNSTDWKATVVTDEGYRVWLTCPRAWIDWAQERQTEAYDAARAARRAAHEAGEDVEDEIPFVGWVDYLRGSRVTFTATLEAGRGGDDPAFRVAKRPSKATLAPAND